MKFDKLANNVNIRTSLPTRGAWIEIEAGDPAWVDKMVSLPTRGAWIEIAVGGLIGIYTKRRSPHGERGLKFPMYSVPGAIGQSLPTRGAWIEILYLIGSYDVHSGRSPHGERGLK